MFPSPNCFNPFDHQPSLKRSSSISYLDHENPSSKQLENEPAPLVFNFPSPFDMEEQVEVGLNQQILSSDQNHNNFIIMHHPPLNQTTDTTTTTNKKLLQAMTPTTAPLRRSRNILGAIPRRRTGKKDRHSKICTAQGIRDRRMRLSLQVARKFFDLQDMLGYDKASQTIEWLFNQSKTAIKDLAQHQLPHDQANNYNNTMMMMMMSTTADAKSTAESFLSSECEVVSQISNINNDIVVPNNPKDDEDEGKLGGLIINKPSSCKMRESRDKARARARCRTREKMMIKRLHSSTRVVPKLCKSNPSDDDDDDDDNLEKLRSNLMMTSPFEGVDDRQSSVNPFSINGVCASSEHHHVADDVGTIEKLLGHYNSTSSSTTFDYSYDAVDPLTMMGFLAAAGNNNWELLNNLDDHRPNSINYNIAGNPNSIYSLAPKFP